jgi:uncharacterized protein YfaS (alpha-2-macroglobulin family)
MRHVRSGRIGSEALGGTTRRQFLMRGGALVGLLAAGGTAALLPSRGGAQAVALTTARRETYTALMETVVTQPSLRLDPAVAPAAAAQFAAAYASWPADRRRDADAVLDALERSTASVGFSRLDRGRRGEELRDHARATSARPAAAERERLELTARALELAAVVLGPPDSGHQIVTV